MKKLIPFLLACIALSTQALASSDSQTASRTGVDDNGRSCFFSYRITKIAPSSVTSRQDIVYNVFVDNLGNCDLRGVEVIDHLSRRVKFLDATPGFVLQDDRVVWNDLRINVGRRAAFFIRVEPRTVQPVEAVTNTGSSFAPQVGQRISATVSTTVFRR